MFDLILKNAYVVDPVNNVQGKNDIGIKNGKIAEVSQDILIEKGKKIIDLKGKMCMPGIIDTHMHLTTKKGKLGYNMLAKAGVTTGFDVLGPIDVIIEDMPIHGSGINIACLNPPIDFSKGFTYDEMSEQDIRDFIDESIEKGAIGIKLVGGHFPMSKELTKQFIKLANDKKVYVAYHVGTSENGSNIKGVEEAIKISKGYRLHLAHINSYCRGHVYDSLTEATMAINMIKENKNIVSESYLSVNNGTFGSCIDGKVVDHVTVNCLKARGYSDTEEDMKKAIHDGYAVPIREYGDELVYIKDPVEGLEYFNENNSQIFVSFPVNKPDAAFLLATAKDENGEFVVAAISTDGGALPRNVIVEKGLPLVKFDALTLKEFVIKASVNPAKMLGLNNKGNLGVGSDADITIIDIDKEVPTMTIAMGEIVMCDGVVFGKGGRIITTEKGGEYIKSKGVEPYIIDIMDTLLYKK